MTLYKYPRRSFLLYQKNSLRDASTSGKFAGIHVLNAMGTILKKNISFNIYFDSFF